MQMEDCVGLLVTLFDDPCEQVRIEAMRAYGRLQIPHQKALRDLAHLAKAILLF